MILPRFAYHQPADLPEALATLADLGDRAKVLAGGTDLLVNMKLGKVRPEHLVALEGLKELGGWSSEADEVSLGARVRAAELAAAGDLPGGLKRAGGALGSPQVRNRATVGGNLVNARPAADICLPLLALGARAVLAGPGGRREVPLAEFFQGPGQTAIAAGEILTAAVFAAPGDGAGSGFAKLGLRQALEIALVNVACTLTLAPDGQTITSGRVALGAVAPTPILSPGAAAALAGAPAQAASLEAAAQAAAADARPIDDHRGSAEYRRQMVAVLTRRALQDALAEARGEEAAS